MSYNPYTDHKCYTGAYDINNEAIPAVSCFATHPGELSLYQEVDTFPYPTVINNVVNNNITPMDKKVISLIASYGYMTSKQIKECLSLLGVTFSDNTIKSSLDRLRKNQIVRVCKFGTDEQHTAAFMAYSLNKNGSEIAKVLGIPHTFAPMQPAVMPSEIKRVLATNQVMLAYIKSSLNVEWMRRGQVITAKDDKSAVVRPSLAVGFSGDAFLIEVVRKGNFWENYLRDKLQRYKLVVEGWSSNSWKLSENPVIVIVGEDTEHNTAIAKIAEEVNLDVYYTEDVLNCGSNFYHSLYQFNEKSKQEFFCLSQDEQTNAA